MKSTVAFIIFSFLLFSCKKETLSKTEDSNLLKYANQIQMSETSDSVFIFSSGEKLGFSKSELPLKTTMVVPTSAISYLNELDLLSVIKGISQPDFVYNSTIIDLYNQNKIEQIGSYDEIFTEKILIEKPDIFITSSGPTLARFHQQIKNSGIRVLYIDEYEEKKPLSRAEYLKVFGKLFGKEKEAEIVFDEIVNNYNEILKIVSDSNLKKPTVFANQIYGDVWYMPGGKSFQSGLFKDAGGDYLWKDDNSEGSLKLSFESVYEKAADASVWMNAGDYPNLKALTGAYSNYEWFDAVKNKKVYNWSKRSNSKGANDYFETGTVRPDMVLKDLSAIFYPELFPGYDLFFYEKLE